MRVIFLRELIKGSCLLVIILLVFILWIHSDGGKTPSNQNTSIQVQDSKKTDEKKKQTIKEQKVYVSRQNGSKLELSMNAYLQGVVASEMSASFEMEALKAQSVAARTFAVQRGYKLDDTTKTQVYHDETQLRQIWGSSYETYHKKIKEAVEATNNEIITYKGKPISAVFFSGSCGKTANANEYWESTSPYLKSVDSHWDKKEKGYAKTIFLSDEEFAQKLGFQNTVHTIEQPKHYLSGYVKSIRIDAITFSGRIVREKLGLRSSCFTIKKVTNGYSITTRGYGHGLGMSQYGAQGMALEGATYREILQHYYTDIKIEKLTR